MIRLFINSSFSPKKQLSLTAPQSHYLTHVMRQTEGDSVVCFNGQQGDWNALLKKQKKDWNLELQKQIIPQQTRQKTTLCLSLIKRDCLVYALQKATELGVSEIYLIKAERSNNERVNMDRLTSIIYEACEQCERNDIPMLFAPDSLSQVMEKLKGKNSFVWLSERGKTKGEKFSLPPAFFIGPEGGWSEKEQALFQQAEAYSWHLGNTILRAETAALTALSLWQYREEIKTLAI